VLWFNITRRYIVLTNWEFFCDSTLQLQLFTLSTYKNKRGEKMKGSSNSISHFLTSLSILLLCIFSFLSCSESSINEPSIPDDASLRKAIIGTWSTNGYRISYFEDGTYIDSSSFRPIETQSWNAQEISKG
jgi:hypothetical protein